MKVNLLLLVLSCLITACKGESSPNTPVTPTEDTTGVSTFITTADNTMHFDKVHRDFGEGLNMMPEQTLTLNPKVTYQDFDGFGAAITGAAAYNLMQMTATNRTKLLTETFSVKEGMGYSYVRVPIGGCDFNVHSNHDYTCCDTKGIENFALTGDETEYIIPILQEIRAINPDILVMGSPWSCPKWMKVADVKTKNLYDSWIGGYLNPDYYQDYATYFVKWIQGFEKAGIPIEAITVENEPLNWGNSMSLYMPWDQQRDFVKTALGPAIQKAGLQTKIIVFDHNYNYDDKSDQKQYPLKIYADADAAKYIDGAAYHNYGGSVTELDNIHSHAPQKNLYFTEASIGTWNYTSYDHSLMWEMKTTCMANVQHWCKAVIVWNFMLDDNNGPHGGSGACNTCYGSVDISSRDYSTLTRNSHFFAIGHMAKALRHGGTRIGTSGYCPTNVIALASNNPDGTYGLVLLNENTQSITMTVEAGEHWFNLTLPSQSITTCVWKK